MKKVKVVKCPSKTKGTCLNNVCNDDDIIYGLEICRKQGKIGRKRFSDENNQDCV